MWREVQQFVSGSSSCGLFYAFRGPNLSPGSYRKPSAVGTGGCMVGCHTSVDEAFCQGSPSGAVRQPGTVRSRAGPGGAAVRGLGFPRRVAAILISKRAL